MNTIAPSPLDQTSTTDPSQSAQIVKAFAALKCHFDTETSVHLRRARIVVTNCALVHSHGRVLLEEAERALYALEGCEPPQSEEGCIEDAIAKAYDGAWVINHTAQFTTDHFTLRLHRNGKAFVWFLDKALRERVNTIIAEHYGETPPTERTHTGSKV